MRKITITLLTLLMSMGAWAHEHEQFVEDSLKMIMTFSKNLISAFLALTFFISTSIESKELDIPGPNLDFLKFEVDKAAKNGDEKRYIKYLTEFGLHCGALYVSETRIQGFCKDKDCLDKLDEFTIHSLAISTMSTLSQTQAIAEISSRGAKIFRWVEDHIAAGTISEAGSLLSEELKTCTKMILGLKENIEEMLEE